MAKIISCCGLNCATCEARIATVNNDDELRKATAEKWTRQYNGPEITPEMINCTGCREPGVKLGNVSVCEVRKCADSKGFRTCAECSTLESCSLIKPIHNFSPEALQNLKNMN